MKMKSNAFQKVILLQAFNVGQMRVSLFGWIMLHVAHLGRLWGPIRRHWISALREVHLACCCRRRCSLSSFSPLIFFV